MVESKELKTAVEGWWIVHTTMILSSAATRLRCPMTAAAEAESRPEVGSSRKTTAGPLMRAMARESLLFCPPDRPLKKALPHLVCWHDSRPRETMSWSTTAFFCSEGTDIEKSAAYSIVSRHVRKGQRWSSCVTMDMWLRNT
mmetsp:Transcript_27969/g.65184  ORF Transcript_27969/g.65184 Transcript_27969/m.65184 type:complete len:142 (+) Transcript_27969:1684-2109(+)